MLDDCRRFAVLEHHRDGVHWDLLVEDGDRLRTWAIAERLAAGVVTSAEERPPHRRIYLDYEGPISGGRGAVIRRDGGTCRVIAWGEDRVALDLAGGQLVGALVLERAERSGSDGRGWVVRFGKLS